jgi:hypothetical protein
MQKMSEDIKILSTRYDCTCFYFADECIPPQRIRDISRMLKEGGIKIFWGIEARPEKGFTYRLFAEAYQQGCRLVSWGVESFSDRVLQMMSKGTDVKGIKKALTSSWRAGIWNNIYVILGFPGETFQEMNKTLNRIFENRDVIDSVNLTTVHLQKHSRMFNQPERFKIIIDKLPADYCHDIYGFGYKGDSNDRINIRMLALEQIKNFFNNGKYRHLWPPAKWDDLVILVTTGTKKQIRRFLDQTLNMGRNKSANSHLMP